jgi:hypothetical protein
VAFPFRTSVAQPIPGSRTCTAEIWGEVIPNTGGPAEKQSLACIGIFAEFDFHLVI